MATDTINLLDEGGMQGCNCKCKGTKSIRNLGPLLPLLWFNAISLGNQIHNSQLLLVCPNNVWPATYPMPPGGSPPLQSGGQNHKWPTSGQGGYITPADRGVPTASEGGAKLVVAHKWVRWLHNPCRLGGPHHFKAGGRIRSGNTRKWKILFFGGDATKRGFESGGTISEIAHKWAQWQSEVGKLIFWVSHLLRKNFLSTK